MTPVCGVLVPVRLGHIPHVGDGGAGEIQGAAIVGKQGFHDVGVVDRIGLEPIDGGHDRRHRILMPEFLDHGINHRGINEGLIALNVDHGCLFSYRICVPPGQSHEGVGHRCDALTAGTAEFCCHQHRKPPALGTGLQLSAIGAQHHRFNTAGLTAALQNTLNHRLAADVGQHLIGQSRRLKPGRNGHHTLTNRHQSQSFIASSRALNHSAASGPPMVRCSRNQGPPKVQCSIGAACSDSGGACTSTR